MNAASMHSADRRFISQSARSDTSAAVNGCFLSGALGISKLLNGTLLRLSPSASRLHRRNLSKGKGRPSIGVPQRFSCRCAKSGARRFGRGESSAGPWNPDIFWQERNGVRCPDGRRVGTDRRPGASGCGRAMSQDRARESRHASTFSRRLV